jgi:hypothetical protein
MGGQFSVQLQATDDNPDDSIRLELLTPPDVVPPFVRIEPGAAAKLDSLKLFFIVAKSYSSHYLLKTVTLSRRLPPPSS